MFHEQNFKGVFPKRQNVKLLSSSMQPFIYHYVNKQRLRTRLSRQSPAVIGQNSSGSGGGGF